MFAVGSAISGATLESDFFFLQSLRVFLVLSIYSQGLFFFSSPFGMTEMINSLVVTDLRAKVFSQ